ncbi:MAG: FxSxx-COOH system tetratricopeptide repeat protein [Ktedonobacterales bacterium]
MKKSSYREQDYAFGKLMLTLRMAIGLSQGALAHLLGVSRNAVGGWEVGQSYPKAEHLKAFITLGLRASVFAAGREEEEIRALWRDAHVKVLLDESWLQDLLNQQQALHLKDVAVEQPSAVPTDEIALWTVPHARNPHFTGRDELLEQLVQQLTPSEPGGQPLAIRRAALTQAQVIKGLGGIGKTQTAVEYAYRAREQGRYTHTLWITAASEESILMSFAALAGQIPSVVSGGETDQHKLVVAVIRWLEQCPQPWLLIFDNADDLSMVQPYLPLRGNGSLLLTTRASAAGWLATSLEVDAMGVMEGTELLLRRARRFDHASDEEINEASNLVVELAQFPLALDQAGAYLEETGCSLSDYLQLYQTHRHALLARRGRQATQYPASVATTWSLSLQHVEETNPAAAELLRLCALLAPDHIPEELLTEGTPHWSPVLQEAVADRFTFNHMLETLLAFSLVKRLAEDRLLSIHRLVQVVQREHLTSEERRQWAERVVQAVHAIFPHDPGAITSWPQCQRYLEQVQACDLLIQDYQLVLPEAAEVLERAGIYLRALALYSLAEPLFRRALNIWEQVVGADHPKAVRSLYDLAQVCALQAEYTAAELLFQRALPVIEQLGRAEHPLLVTALCALADLYNNQGKYAQAEPLYRRALLIGEQLGGPDQVRLIGVLNGLAFVQTQNGERTEAELLYQRALRLCEQQLGLEHLRLTYSLLGLANLYTQQGKHELAESLFQRALHIREQQLGSENLLVVDPLRGLANVYTQQGKYELAEPLFQRALHICEQQLGSEHLETARALYDFAAFHQTQRQTEQAVFLYRRALLIFDQALGPSDPMTVDTGRRLDAVLNRTEETAQTEG